MDFYKKFEKKKIILDVKVMDVIFINYNWIVILSNIKTKLKLVCKLFTFN